MKGLKGYIRVEVSHDGFADDDKIEAIAKRYRGELYGSGAGFGMRDLGFGFKSLEKAKSFTSTIRRAYSRAISKKIMKTETFLSIDCEPLGIYAESFPIEL